MTAPVAVSARKAALEVLLQAQQKHQHLADAFEHLAADVDRRNLATELVCGVARNATLLDTLLKRLVGADKKKTDPPVWMLLRLGVYELVFAPHTPEYAIVSEYVNLAKAFDNPKAQGFVNAVLRTVQRAIAQRDLPAGQTNSAFSATCGVVRPDGSVCVFRQAVLPEPNQKRLEYLHTLWSLPVWLIKAWEEAYGSSQAEALCRASNRQPSVYAWPNPLRIDANGLAEKLQREGVECRIWPQRQAVAIRTGKPISHLKSFQEGLFYVQDPAARATVEMLKPKPDQIYVDVCGAPGGKAIALAFLMQDKGRIVLSDTDPDRLDLARQNVNRLGLQSIECVPPHYVEIELSRLKQCDGVILDVPCSNTGVLARRLEVRWRQTPEKVQSLCQYQKELLKNTAALLKPNVRLLYATCSLLAEENENQIQQFLLDNPHFYLLNQKTFFASVDHGGGFDSDGAYGAVVLMR